MNKGIFTWSGFLLRLLFALTLVYASYNPEGYSYFHWIQASLSHTETGLLGSNALKFVVGILLLIGWIIYASATRNSLGLVGVILILALSGGVIWLFAEMNLFNPDNVRALEHLTEIVVALILALGMSWSHISHSLTGQVDVDEHHR
jgi:RsiW-degrading membrane proteinase PrsW (M82 family)